jgi:hypothetical protein
VPDNDYTVIRSTGHVRQPGGTPSYLVVVTGQQAPYHIPSDTNELLAELKDGVSTPDFL